MKKTIEIDGMSCHHCVRAIESALHSLEGVSVEAVEIGSATIDVNGDEDLRRVKDSIEQEGYTVVER